MKQRKITMVIGKTGYGKSYFINAHLPKIERCLILDIAGEYDLPGFEIFTDFDSFRSYCQVHHNNGLLQMIVRFDSDEEYENTFEIAYILEDITIVVEELHTFCSPYYIVPRLKNIIRLGRHQSVSLIGITQRFADLNPIIRSNIDLIVAFQCPNPLDMAALGTVPFVDVVDAERVGSLPRYEFIAFWNY